VVLQNTPTISPMNRQAIADRKGGLSSVHVSSAVKEEYAAAISGVGLLYRSDAGVIKVSGKDGLDLLNRLSTNKLVGLELGRGASTVLTNNKGRILDLLTVIHRGNHLLLLTSRQAVRKVMDWIDTYTFLEVVVLEDVTEQSAVLHVLGPKSALLLKSLFGTDTSKIRLFSSAEVRIGRIEVTAVRTDSLRILGFDLIVPASSVDDVRNAIFERGNRHGVRAVGAEASEIIRIEEGIPVCGKELGERFNPLEAGLIDSISFSKGCYIGQEVIARLNTYKKVQRHLMGVAIDSESLPPGGAKLKVGKKEAGFVTSSAWSLLLGRPIALAFVKKEMAKAGLGVSVVWNDVEVNGSLAGLPFYSSTAPVSQEA